MKMHTLGHTASCRPRIHAGGLRYHAMAPLLCHLYDRASSRRKRTRRTRASRRRCCSPGQRESSPRRSRSHAIRAAIDEALAAKEAGESKLILFNLERSRPPGPPAYDDYLAGNLVDVEYEPQREAVAV